MGNKAIVVAAILILWTGSTLAQTMSGSGSTSPVLASTLASARGGAKLKVSSSAFSDGGTLPEVYTQNGRNISPPLSWSHGPAGTKSYVVLTEDSGVARPQPIYHWVLYNVPANVTSLQQALPTDPKLSAPAGAMNGLNIRKASGYMGPKPPPGQTHPYHFEVFAVDKVLNLDPNTADRNAIVDAMKGHVLAEGETVGMYTGK